MRCSVCHRPLLRAAVAVGHLRLGPVCAQRAGLVQPKPRRVRIMTARVPARADELTPDLFSDAVENGDVK